MKTMRERLKTRMRVDRPMTTISIRLPEDLIDDLKELAPSLGFAGYQPLIRAYISRGIRKDQLDLEHSQIKGLTNSLRKQGIPDDVIANAVAEASHRAA